MRPDEPQNQVPSSPVSQPANTALSAVPAVSPKAQEAASNIVRSQIETIYNETPADKQQPTAEQWKHYHSSWQDYYRQYYERYYMTYLHHARQALSSQKAQEPTPASTAQPTVLGSGPKIEEKNAEPIDREEAMYDLHNRLVGNVQAAAQKVRKSRHFVPITASICVMLLFGFLQYNQLLIANVKAYISPGDIDPQNIIVDPTMSTSVDPASTQLVIPKINVDVPVDYNAKPDYDSQMASMKNGLAYFGISGADSKPGQIGNTPIAGHSSNDVLDSGNYKFIFAQLDKLQVGDSIYANYQGTRYTYIVKEKSIVLPTEIDKLIYPTDKPLLTLITCTPLGTSQKRLLVTAEQVSPSPTKAAPAPEKTSSTSTDKPVMAGTSPTFFEQLFGAR